MLFVTPLFILKLNLVNSYGYEPGNAEACSFLIIIPIVILFNLLLAYLLDESSKNFANALCKLMFISIKEENSFFIDCKNFTYDCWNFIKSQK